MAHCFGREYCYLQGEQQWRIALAVSIVICREKTMAHCFGREYCYLQGEQQRRIALAVSIVIRREKNNGALL